jgi:prevent-host-death family protein
MRDYSGAAGPSRTKTTVGVRELKTHAARILRRVREARASYILTHRGRAVGVILPIDGADVSQSAEDGTTAWNAFLRAGRRLEHRFRPGVSGVRLLSATRR